MAGNVIVAVYTLGSVSCADPTLLATGFFYMFGINLLGMMVCYSLELMSRRDFMLNYLLKRAEKTAKDMNVRLERMVKERTQALNETNDELKISIRREKTLVSKLEKEGKALQESLDSLERAESFARLGYFERNWQTGYAYWSKGFFRLIGYENTSASTTHEEFLKFVYEEDRNRVIEHIRESLEKHRPIEIEFRLAQPRGTTVQIRGVADNFYSDDGKPLLTRGFFQDITDRKETESKLKRIENQLVQAQKMEAVGRLAGGVAHDYNNISSIIIGYAELALENIESDTPLHDDLTEILTAAKRSTEITRQLLAFARRQTVSPKVLDLNDTIANMLKMLRRLIGEDIDLAWLPGSDLWPVKIDPSQVDQILANLCVNARDAIADVGKIAIETKNASFDEDYCAGHAGFVPGAFVMLAISDDGCGMAPETLDKIFEPFFTTKGLGKGTGLGLATVYGIVKQNKGFINVYSELKNGTTINVYFPRHAGEAVLAQSENMSEIPLSRGETILLVEDDDSILKLGKRILEEMGYNVLAVDTPGEAIETAKKHVGRIDLLITDVIMPEMNGRELSEQLRNLCAELRTLYMSGYTANIIAHRSVLKDGVHFISKPFSRQDMALKIREALGSSPEL